MISLILPYWQRAAAAKRALEQLEKVYRGLDIEVVIVDDGNPEPYVPPVVDLDIRVVRLPAKTGPMCPCTAWNAGVAASRAQVICLSCIEIIHEQPVLPEMLKQLRAMGRKGYVLAAAWCPESKSWHCHSSVSVPVCPPGTGIAFCGLMYRRLFDSVGGFDEAFRDGAGYEDRDLIRRLHRAGAKFVIRDDLVVTHPKTGATIGWTAEAFARNEGLFHAKWH